MSFAAFRESAITGGSLPPGLPGPLQALWHDVRGEWARAHGLVQSDESVEAAWVHAYLHRKEGDQGNAAYWYRRAGRPVPTSDMELMAEWESIARALMN